MSLVPCPECGNPTSDQAGICPKCGCPLEGGSEPSTALLTINTERGRTDFVVSEITAISFFQKTGFIKFILLLSIGGAVLLAFLLHPLAGIVASIYGVFWTVTLFKSTGYIATTGDVTRFSVSWSGFERVVEDYKKRIGTEIIEVREYEGAYEYHHVINPDRVAHMSVSGDNSTWPLITLGLILGGLGFVLHDSDSSREMMLLSLGAGAFFVFLGFALSHAALNVTSAGSHEFALRMASGKANETAALLRKRIHRGPAKRRRAGHHGPGPVVAPPATLARGEAQGSAPRWDALVTDPPRERPRAPVAPGQWYGVLHLGTGEVREFRISRAPVTLGRGERCEVRVDDERVSRAHLRLEEVADGIRVEDLGSTNGTWFEGTQRIRRGTAKVGDWFLFGGCRLALERK